MNRDDLVIVDVTQADIDAAIAARKEFKSKHNGCWGDMCPISQSLFRETGVRVWTTEFRVAIDYPDKYVTLEGDDLQEFVNFVDAHIDYDTTQIKPAQIRLNVAKVIVDG